MRQSPSNRLLSSQITGVRPATGGEKRAKRARPFLRAPDPRLTDFRRALVAERAAGVGQAVERLVVEYERLAVGAHLDVAFDGEAGRDRRFGRAERVFDHPLFDVMQATVRDRALGQPGWSVERSQGAISKRASPLAAIGAGCGRKTDKGLRGFWVSLI